MATPISVSGVKSHLVGLDPWLDAALAADQAYGGTAIANVAQATVRRFERETQFQVNQVQCSVYPDGTYDNGAGMASDGVHPLIVESAYHYTQSQASAYFETTLRRRPVQQVQRFRIMANPTTLLYAFPAEWYHVEAQTGRLWTIPFGGMYISSALGSLALATVQGWSPVVPALMAVDYVAGLPDGWTALDDWADLNRCLEEYTAYWVLQDIAQIFDPGLASVSAGADGASQTFSYDRFQGRKQELLTSVQAFQATLASQETPLLFGVV